MFVLGPLLSLNKAEALNPKQRVNPLGACHSALAKALRLDVPANLARPVPVEVVGAET